MTTRPRPSSHPLARFTLVPLLLTGACAGYDIIPLRPGDAAISNWGVSPEDGYIIYEPHPYLRIVQTTQDGKLSVAADIIYLPNRHRPYRVSTFAILATADIKLTYNDGWQLTNAQSNVDTASVAKAVVEAVGGFASVLQETAPVQSTYSVRLFRLEFHDDGLLSSVEEVKEAAVSGVATAPDSKVK